MNEAQVNGTQADDTQVDGTLNGDTLADETLEDRRRKRWPGRGEAAAAQAERGSCGSWCGRRAKMEAAELLGVNYKTLARAERSGETTGRMGDALARLLGTGDDPEVARLRESVGTVEERVAAFGGRHGGAAEGAAGRSVQAAGAECGTGQRTGGRAGRGRGHRGRATPGA